MFAPIFPRFGVIALLTCLLMSSYTVSADVEPNDSRDTSENVNLGQVILGTLETSFDIHDFYNVTLDADEKIVAVLDGPDDADFNLALYDDGGFILEGGSSDADADEILTYTPITNGSYYFEIRASHGGGPYTFEVKMPETSPNSTYSLMEAESFGYIKVKTTGTYVGEAESFNLETGKDVFFGQSLEIEVTNLLANAIDIIIPEGQLFTAHNTFEENKVVTRRDTVSVNALSKAYKKLYAMSTDMRKNVPDADSLFRVGDNVTGDLRKVVEELNSSDTQSAVGQVAVWMVTDSAQKDELRQLGASDSQIDEAVTILEVVGVDPPFSHDDTLELDFIACLGLIVLAISLIILIALLSRRFGEKQGETTSRDTYSEDGKASMNDKDEGEDEEPVKSSPKETEQE